MSTILGACYPDVFAAIGVHSGEEYIRGMTREEAKRVPSRGGPDPDRQGVLAHACAGDAAAPIPALVIHGDDDNLASPINGEQAFRQIVQQNDLADDGDDDDSIAVAKARRTRIRGATVDTVWHGGKPLVRHIRVAGLGHDWSGSAADGTSELPDATRLMWSFFKLHVRGHSPGI
jgi:poly(3-hydroxybutyrate) depolymerase